MHRDTAGFDFDVSPVDRKLVSTRATTAFTDDAHTVKTLHLDLVSLGIGKAPPMPA